MKTRKRWKCPHSDGLKNFIPGVKDMIKLIIRNFPRERVHLIIYFFRSLDISSPKPQKVEIGNTSIYSIG